MEFIQSGKNKLDFITKGSESEDVAVEVEFKGADLNDIIHDEKLNLNKYSEYVIDNGDGTYSLRVLRTSQECDVIQGKKTVSLDLSKVRIYNQILSKRGAKNLKTLRELLILFLLF